MQNSEYEAIRRRQSEREARRRVDRAYASLTNRTGIVKKPLVGKPRISEMAESQSEPPKEENGKGEGFGSRAVGIAKGTVRRLNDAAKDVGYFSYGVGSIAGDMAKGAGRWAKKGVESAVRPLAQIRDIGKKKFESRGK